MLARQLLLRRARMPTRAGARGDRRASRTSTRRPATPASGLGSTGSRATTSRARSSGAASCRATLMRSTIHLVSPRDYWLFSAGVGPSRAGALAAHPRQAVPGHRPGASWPRRCAASWPAASRTRARSSTTLLRAHGSTVWGGAWVELDPRAAVRHVGAAPGRPVPARRRVARARDDPTEAEGIEHLLRRYLRALRAGVAADDAANWAGVAVDKMRDVGRAARSCAASATRTASRWSTCLAPRSPAPPPGTAALPPAPGTQPCSSTRGARRSSPSASGRGSSTARRRSRSRRSSSTVPSPARGASSGAHAKATLVARAVRAAAARGRRELRDEGAGLVRFYEPDATSFAVRTLRPAG